MNNLDKNRDNEYIDISSGTPVGTHTGGAHSTAKHAGAGGGKKKVIILVSVAVAFVAALGTAGFFLFRNQPKETETIPENTTEPEFVFTDNTVVSGVDISGKTMDQAKKLLEQNSKNFAKPISFHIDVNGKDYQLKESDFNYTYDIDDVLTQVKIDSGNGGIIKDYTIKATVQEDSITSNVEKICEENNKDSKNARVTEFHPYSDDRFTFADAEDGKKVDEKSLTKQIKESFADNIDESNIKADVETKKADVNASALKDKLVKLSTYETYSTNTENGTSNMRVSMEACNGSIIEPGDVWSFNECTGDSNQESRGYKPASVISEGKIIDGIGGGICQSSSTIYNAGVRSNMTIEERHEHQWASSYVPTGLDATIDFPGLDLKMKNSTDFQMFLECKVVGNTLYASFWGVKSDKWDEIHTQNEISDTGSKTYTVRAWRVYFKDGQEVGSEELFKSTYDMDNGVIFYQADNDARAIDSNASSNQSSNDQESLYDEQNESVINDNLQIDDPTEYRGENPVYSDYDMSENDV